MWASFDGARIACSAALWGLDYRPTPGPRPRLGESDFLGGGCERAILEFPSRIAWSRLLMV